MRMERLGDSPHRQWLPHRPTHFPDLNYQGSLFTGLVIESVADMATGPTGDAREMFCPDELVQQRRVSSVREYSRTGLDAVNRMVRSDLYREL